MIYTPLTNKAMRLAYDAHHGQADKSGLPYIFHPYHLAEQMTDEITVCAALLHDVVEDTSVNIEETGTGISKGGDRCSAPADSCRWDGLFRLCEGDR